jgi:hypothetical protein
MKYSKDITYVLIAIIVLGLLFYVSKKENLDGDSLTQMKTGLKKDEKGLKKKLVRFRERN